MSQLWIGRRNTVSPRKCSARCYNAKSKECRCQCNGVNHSVGETRARENFQRLGLVWKTPKIRPVTFQRKRRRRVHPGQGVLFALNCGFMAMDANAEFSGGRLPHLEEMSEQQHALVTLINAACYVTDEESKQMLLAKLCEHVGLEITW